MTEIPSLLLMILMSGFSINHVISKNRIIKIPSKIPGLVFILLSMPLLKLNASWSFMIHVFLLILIYGEIVCLSEKFQIKTAVFKTGLFTGCLSLLDYQYMLYGPTIVVALIYYRQFNIKNLLIQLTGLIYPLMIFWGIRFLGFFDDPLSLNNTLLNINYYELVEYKFFLFVTCAIFILSLKELYANYYKKLENEKMAFNVLLCFLIIHIIQLCFFNARNSIFLLNIPIAIIIGNYLIYRKSQKSQAFLLGLLVVSFIIQFF